MSIFVGTTTTIKEEPYSQPGIYDENDNPNGQTYQPDISVDLNMHVAGDTLRNNTPVVMPYGFQSIPYDNLSCVHSGPPNFTSSVVLGYLNSSYGQSNAKGLQSGESEIFNKTNYAFRLQLDKILAKWINTDESDEDKKKKECKIAIGDNVVNLLVEVYAQVQAYIDAMNEQWEQKFNMHTHTYVPGNNPQTNTGTPSVTATDYTPRSNFTHMKDDELKDGTTCYIDDHGLVYTPT